MVIWDVHYIPRLGHQAKYEWSTKLLCQMLLGLLFQLFFNYTIGYTSEGNDSDMSLGAGSPFILLEVITMATSGCNSGSWNGQSIKKKFFNIQYLVRNT